MCFLLLNLARFVLACSDGCFMPSRYYRIITTEMLLFRFSRAVFHENKPCKSKLLTIIFLRYKEQHCCPCQIYISTVRKKEASYWEPHNDLQSVESIEKGKGDEKIKPITNPKKLQDCRFTRSNWINFVFDLILH
jgi:hypothetical protein